MKKTLIENQIQEVAKLDRIVLLTEQNKSKKIIMPSIISHL